MLTDSDFSVYVLTAPRPRNINYLSGLLKLLEETDTPIPRIVVGVPEQGEAAPFDWKKVRGHRRIAYGKVKLFKVAMKDPAPYVVFLEDDARPVEGWWPRLKETVADITIRYKRFFMTLYTNIDRPLHRAAQRGELWCRMPLTGDSGNVGQVISRSALGELACHIQRYCVDRPGQPSDMTMAKAAKVAAIQQVTSVPSLVTHVGVITTKGYKRSARHAPFLYKVTS